MDVHRHVHRSLHGAGSDETQMSTCTSLQISSRIDGVTAGVPSGLFLFRSVL